ncbi:MAG: NHLP bacteriocin export ABC transporter permease/ATPase subunit [Candidatus Riflebacteria bacterium]|nr:NHLP bacteriocin export ABC transporter permease/ATPase subunit [Candidatus Riflebacteria bacterium]
MNESQNNVLYNLSESDKRRICADGSHQISLVGSSSVFLIESGRVDVFGSTQNEDGVEGRRRQIARFNQGDILFSLESPLSAGDGAENIFLNAVGAIGTSVVAIPTRVFLDWLCRKADSQERKRIFETWVNGITEGLLPELPPKTLNSLETGKLFETSGVELARPAVSGWLTIQKGSVWWLENNIIASPDIPFPLSMKGWVEIAPESHCIFSSFEDSIEPANCLEALNSFLKGSLAALKRRDETSRQIERARREKRTISTEILSKIAWANLTASPDKSDVFPSEALSTAEPMLNAMRLVANSMGLNFPEMKISSSGRLFDLGRMAEITSHARLRFRKVILVDNWWEKENTAMLSFYEETNEPVALIPSSPSSCRIVSGRNGASQPVNAETTKQIAPFAYIFYKTFPDKILSLSEIFSFSLAGSRGDFLGIAVLSTLAALLTLVIPAITGVIFDRAVPESDKSLLFAGFCAVIAGALISSLWQYARIFFTLRIETRMNSLLQAGIIDRLLRMPTAFFRKFAVADLARRAISVNEIRRELGTSFIQSLLLVFTIVLQLAFLFWNNVSLAKWAVGIGVFVFFVYFLVAVMVLRYFREQWNKKSRQSAFVLQSILGVAKLKVAEAGPRAFKFWTETFTEEKRCSYRAGKWGNLLEVFNSIFPILSYILIFYQAVQALLPPATPSALPFIPLKLGDFLAFSASFNVFISSICELGSQIQVVGRIVPQIERFIELFKTAPESEKVVNDPGELSGEIEISRVTFRYHEDGPMILNDISFRVKPGEFVAIVGPSGSGKSTLLRLLLGFEFPESGSVQYDGKNLADLSLTAVRSQIGAVLQTGRLSGGSIFQLIAGDGQYNLDEVWTAARLAGFDQDIESMPMQMHTVVGDGATTLSGGQKQRLLIARALIKKPRIVFFDEATSALDNRTQQIVSESLKKLHSTRLVIAHRLSSVQSADCILVVQNGKLVEAGKYNELMNKNGLFAALARRQIV